MANKNIFGNASGSKVPDATTVNNAGGVAYDYNDKVALATIAATNCFNGTYYVDATANLELAKNAVNKLRNDPEFVAKVAVYCRGKAHMKDMPAYLCAILASWKENTLFRKTFRKAIDNTKMLRNFIQICRSGALGKKLNVSSGSIRHAVREWFSKKSAEYIFKTSIGNDPTIRDILRMTHPRPETKEKEALYAYLLGHSFDRKEGCKITRKVKGETVTTTYNFTDLPPLVQQYETFKATHEGEIPNVDFRMLDSVLKGDELNKLWQKQAENAPWTLTRMNLNNFQKYGVFNDKKLINVVADRLKNPEAIKKAKAYPYQLLVAYLNTTDVPHIVRESLQDALDASLVNIPEIKGQIYICVDVSGSMSSAITGMRGSATTKVRCIDVAALFAASLLRTNKSAKVIPFATAVHNHNLNPRDSVMTNATTLASFGGGGTDCSCALRSLNSSNAKGDAVIFISDNESWVGAARYSRGTGMMEEWTNFKKRNSKAKLICLDIVPSSSSQATSNADILQVGGFGDSVFDVVASFLESDGKQDHWVDVINKVDLDATNAPATPVTETPVTGNDD